MKDFIATKLVLRKKIDPEFKKTVKAARESLLELQKKIDHEESSGQKFEEIREKYYGNLERQVELLLRETDRIADPFSHDEHLLHKDFLRDQLGPFLAPAALNHRAWKKPLGYAGDYLMMKMLYDEDPFVGETAFYKMINATACRCISGLFCRERVPYLLEKFDRLGRKAVARRGKFLVLDLACGPSEEIVRFLKENPLSRRTEFHLIDQDKEAIAYSQKRIDEARQETGIDMKIVMHPQSIKDLVLSGDAAKLPRFDLIYSGGLFDYFDDDTFDMAVSLLYELLDEGGELALGNISPEDYSKTVKWYLADWPLIYRTRDDLLRFAPTNPRPKEVKIESESTGVNLFLVVKK